MSLSPAAATTRRDLLLLAAICAVVYATGLTVHGIANWQEAQRIVVAQEMQRRGDWLVPTINDKPYLAKPPVIYWCQLALAELSGTKVGLFHIRLTVALAGLTGVLATYLVARRLMMLGSTDPPTRIPADRAAWAREVALWSALGLATGVLYVRSSRTGELDILLAPLTVIAIGAIAQAWETARDLRKANWGAIAVATAATSAAAMTKGPPAIMVIALAGFGSMALWAAFTSEPLDTRPFSRPDPSRDAPAPPTPRWVNVCGAALGFTGAAGAGVRSATETGHATGVALLGMCGAVVGVLAARLLAQRQRGLAAFTAWSRTHPLIVLGVPVAVLWGWHRLVMARIGPEAARLVVEEAEENLQLFQPESPMLNFGVASYAVGLGSIAAMGALVWFVKDRPQWRTGWWVVGAWVLLGLIAFSLLGKGVQRYLTPVWPGVAILGGMLLGTMVHDRPRPRAIRASLGVIVALAAIGQAFWYGYGRERWFGEKTPQALIAELRRPELGVDLDRLVTFEFHTSAVDAYVGHWVQTVGETGMRPAITGGESWTIEEFARRVRESGEVWTVLVRTAARGEHERAPIERLAEAGLVVQTVPVRSRFLIDTGRSQVTAVRVWALGS